MWFLERWRLLPPAQCPEFQDEIGSAFGASRPFLKSRVSLRGPIRYGSYFSIKAIKAYTRLIEKRPTLLGLLIREEAPAPL